VRPIFVLFLLAAACGNGEKQCQAHDPASGAPVTGSAAGDSFTYGRFNSSPNNDCPDGGGVISVTIEAEQVGPAECTPRCVFNLCLPRPDLIGEEPISLADTDLVRVDTLAGRVGNCVTLRSDRAPPTGTVTFLGFCTTAGTSYVVSLSGSVPGTRTCGTGPEIEVDIALSGQADVVSL
jgi:hypothetical protein